MLIGGSADIWQVFLLKNSYCNIFNGYLHDVGTCDRSDTMRRNFSSGELYRYRLLQDGGHRNFVAALFFRGIHRAIRTVNKGFDFFIGQILDYADAYRYF